MSKYANENAFRDALVEALTPELKANDFQFNEEVLIQKVGETIEEFRVYRRYPSSYSKEKILADMERYAGKIKYAAFVRYGQIGTYGELYHYENTVHRSWPHDYELWYGVLPISQVH